jgi:hypothetical protein
VISQVVELMLSPPGSVGLVEQDVMGVPPDILALMVVEIPFTRDLFTGAVPYDRLVGATTVSLILIITEVEILPASLDAVME